MTYDIAIVGAGIVGIAHALAASRLGLRVVVIDRDQRSVGASIRNFGFVTVTGQQQGECWRRAMRSRDIWEEVAPQAGIPILHQGLAVVARRPEATVVLEAFRNHPEMVLREDDIVAFRVNWEDKAANIKAIADTIELGLESFVFLDDNPAERKRVRDALPAVAVPELPDDPSEWLAVFQAAGYFEQTSFSQEDQQRAAFYKANAQRAAQMERIGNHDDYLRSLDMVLSIAPFDTAGRKRIVQLIGKSNQFNLTTKRYGEAEVAEVAADPDALTIQARLVDIFGDNGVISVVICRKVEENWTLDSWIMSCRVLGRRVEEAILQYIVTQARARGIAELVGRYIPTARNGLVRDHYEKLGFTKADERDGETSWRLDIGGYTDKPVPVRIETRPNGAPAVAD